MQKTIFPIILFLIGFYLVGIRVVGFQFEGIPGDQGDGRLNNYFLEQGYRSLSGKTNSYWNAPFFYPEKMTMSMSDNLWGTLPIYASFRMVRFDRETAYQLWYLVLLCLNFWSCFFCFRKMKMSAGAASAGAYLFAFSLPVIGGLSHIQMFPKFIFPWIIYLVLKFIEEKRSVTFFFLLLSLVYQMYCGIYLGLMSLLIAGITLVIVIFQKGWKNQLRAIRTFARKNFLSIGIYTLLNTGILLLLMWPYLVRSEGVERNYHNIAWGLPTPGSYALPPDHTLFFQWLRPLAKIIPNSHEHELFMGFTFILAIGGACAVWKNHKEIRFWVIGFIAVFLATLNFYQDISIYAIIFHIPGFEAIRAGSRIIQLELFFIGGWVACLVDILLKRFTPSFKPVPVLIAGCAFMVADQFVFTSGMNTHWKLEARNRVEKLKERVSSLDRQNAPAFVYLPSDTSKIFRFHIDAMIVAQELDFPCVNGYTGFTPKPYAWFFETPDSSTFAVLKEEKMPHQDILVVTD